MRTNLTALTMAIVLATGLCGAAQAQYYDPIQAEMQRLEAQIDAMVADSQRQYMAAMQQANDEAAAYYREQTGDYQTPDHVAADRGREIYCQRNPVECRQTAEGWAEVARRGHELRMNDIASFGQTSLDIGRTNSEILDMSHQGYLDRDAATSAGQANLVQGAIQGAWTYGDPSTGAGYDLPVWPDPQMRYATPEGQPLSFDYQSGTWYVGDANGFWQPLQPRR